MNGEKLMDAMNLLPNDILEETDKLRKRKTFPWKSLTALAACLCLVAGLWLVSPALRGVSSAESAEAPAQEVADAHFSDHQASTGHSKAVFTVVAVYEDHITAHPGRQSVLLDETPVTITFENLETLPKLEEGQYISIYPVETEAEVYKPTTIEIEEDTP